MLKTHFQLVNSIQKLSTSHKEQFCCGHGGLVKKYIKLREQYNTTPPTKRDCLVSQRLSRGIILSRGMMLKTQFQLVKTVWHVKSCSTVLQICKYYCHKSLSGNGAGSMNYATPSGTTGQQWLPFICTKKVRPAADPMSLCGPSRDFINIQYT